MSKRSRLALLLLLAGPLAGCSDRPDTGGPEALLAPHVLQLPPESASDNAHALSFGGLGGRVSIPYAAAYKNPEFTIEVWVKPKTVQSTFTPLIASSNTNEWNTADGFSLKFESDRVYLRAAKASNLAAGYYASYEPPAGRWTHLAGTFDGVFARVYVNGELKVETADERPVWYGTRGLFLAAGYHSQFGGPTSFNGMMDEVRIWSYARNGGEIRSAMEGELAGDEPGLVGYWNFEEQNGAVVKDVSPTGANGLISGWAVQYVASTPF